MNNTAKSDDWTTIIRPQYSWFELRLGELWQARDLVKLFVWRDFVAAYKQTILGPVWYLIQPILTTTIFTIIFGRIANLPTDGLPGFLFYMSGTIIWGYFAACLTKTSATFTANANVFGKVYFPRLAVPISIIISNLIAFAIQFALFLVMILYFALASEKVRFTGWILLTPFLLILMAGIGLGFGIIISSLTTRYRDLQNLVGFGVQLLMYATPIIYPYSSVPTGYRWLILANPLTPVVETFRFASLGAGTIIGWPLLYTFLCMCCILLVGLLMFNRVERTFMDTV